MSNVKRGATNVFTCFIDTCRKNHTHWRYCCYDFYLL